MDNATIKQNRAEWFAAMRSGEYTQDINRLKTSNGHCCYGVLCDLAVKRGEGQWIERDGKTYYDPSGIGSGVGTIEFFGEMPPSDMAQAVGIPFHAEIFAEMNDHGISYKGIMDEFELRYPLYGD